jgi:hypothetical protein
VKELNFQYYISFLIFCQGQDKKQRHRPVLKLKKPSNVTKKERYKKEPSVLP